MITYTKADVIARAAKLDKYGHKQAAKMLRDFAPMIDQPQSAGGVSQPELGDGMSVNIFGLISAIKQIPIRREAMSGQMLTYVQLDEVIGTVEDFASRHARGAPQLAEMNEELLAILGKPNFVCSPYAHLMKRAGVIKIPPKSEVEQAHVLLWMLQHYLAHGNAWSEAANADVSRWHSMLAAQPTKDVQS